MHYKKVRMKKIEAGKTSADEEGLVIEDKKFAYYVNGEKKFEMTIMPLDVVETGIGHMIGDGIINAGSKIVNSKIKDDRVEFQIENKVPSKKADLNVKINSEIIAQSMKGMLKGTETWKQTGGVHTASIYDLEGNMLLSADDITKGTAVDKVIGKGFLAGLDFSKTMIVSTGRILDFIVIKAVRAGIPIVVSKGAPISSGIKVADEGGVTLICFARGGKMNIYTHAERVIV